jgi:hypothetical protein
MEHPVMYIKHTTSFLEHIHLMTFHVMNAGFGSVLDGDISYLLPSATNCVPHHASFCGLVVDVQLKKGGLSSEIQTITQILT